MIFKADKDECGNVEQFTADKLRRILDLIDEYMKNVPYIIHEIRQDNVADKHGRIDIEIRYVNKANCVIQQKLLILDDELIDGKEFHRRFKEWY